MFVCCLIPVFLTQKRMYLSIRTQHYTYLKRNGTFKQNNTYISALVGVELSLRGQMQYSTALFLKLQTVTQILAGRVSRLRLTEEEKS